MYIHIKNIFIHIILAIAIASCKKTVVPDEQISALLNAKNDSLPVEVDYNLHIRPLLSDNCFNCHGPDKNKREANLALHLQEAAYEQVNGNYAIVPGEAHKSEVVARILTNDPDKMMPLPMSNLKLTDLQKALIVKWIQQGAKYKPHWAFIAPVKYNVPDIKDNNFIKNEIDAFVLQKMTEKGLSPSPQASKIKLARRVAFDLTGLQPDEKLLQTYLNDNTPKAYENMVDALLCSPQYGERMANEWCDVARYADSHGYQDDGESEMWPWRDWVIKVFNQNMPYNQFITEQMAGDLLPNPTKDQILATGFHRNHMINAEGGIIDEEFRTEYVLDRVNTTGKAFLALTVECARCHDHKYDPISQKEYYQMASFFNQLDECGKGNLYENTTGPTLLLTDTETDKKLAEIVKKYTIEDDKIAKIIQNMPIEGLAQKLKNMSQDSLIAKYTVGYFSFETKAPLDSTIYLNNKDTVGKISIHNSFQKGYKGNALAIDGEYPSKLDNPKYDFERNQPFSVGIWIWVPDNAAKGYTLLANCATTYHGFRGYEILAMGGKIQARITNSWPSNAISVITQDTIVPRTWQYVALTYNGSSKAEGMNVYINGEIQKSFVMLDHLDQTIRTHTVEEDKKQFFYYNNLQKKRKLSITEEKILRQLNFRAWYSKTQYLAFASRTDQGIQPLYNGKIDEVKVYNRDLTPVEVFAQYKEIMLNEALEAKKWDNNDLKKLAAVYFSKEYTQTQKKNISLRGEENNLTLAVRQVKVMKDRPQKRETYTLDRGAYDAPKDKVTEGTIQAVMKFDDKMPKNRLGLAKWLTDPKNPMVARVAVNRYWQMLFGNGLVASSGDFGNQGNYPSHPELLDWLSIWFTEHNWDVKALLKLMVMTSTYRQTSDIDPAKYTIDPQNMYLSRGARYRMPMEMIRDQALTASKLINLTIGGPSFKPYQPDGLWEEKTESPVNNYYVADKAPEIYRRSMYIWHKRTSPHPYTTAFDGPERFVCQVKRQTTNTPLQALNLLNDPQFVECARVLAQKTLAQNNTTPVDDVFYAILQRKPSDNERNILLTQYKYFKKTLSNTKINSLINVGYYPINPKINKADMASLAMVAHTIYNLDEFITRE
ncbi:MAG: DUF1553 domain-containing protein [Cytophagales bacterium]|nr:DUF1553 domain-containing protein [Cytophagales bacterium]